ncbi:MAG: EAL domain-containing protein [Pseudomonadota bacterium]
MKTRRPFPTLLRQLNPFRRSLQRQTQRSLVANITFQVLFAGLALALLFAAISLPYAQNEESERLMQQVDELLTTQANTASIACYSEDPVLAGEVAQGLLTNRAVAAVHIESGAHTLSNLRKPGVSGGTNAGTVERLMHSPFAPEEVVGKVVLEIDREYVQTEARARSRMLAISALLEAIAVALVVGSIILHTVARPIRRFAEDLHMLHAETGEHIVAPTGHADDEIGQLTVAFNRLIDGMSQLLAKEQQMRVQLAHKEGQFRALAENSPSIIVRYDLEYRRIYFNPAYAESFSDGKNARDKTPLEFWRITNLTPDAYIDVLRRVIVYGNSEEVFLESVQPNGKRLTFIFHIVPEWGADGYITGAMAIGLDISAIQHQQKLDGERARIFEYLAKGGELPTALEQVAHYVETARPECKCSILLLDAQNRLRTGAAPSLPAHYTAAIDGAAIGDGAGSCGTAAWRGETVIVEDVFSHPYWTPYRDLAKSAGVAACWSEPLRASDGKVLGTLAIYRDAPAVPEAEDLALMRQASALSAIAIERKHIEEKMKHQASYDGLTGLPNRRMFGDRLREEIAKAQRTGGKVALLFIDLDRFKNVNDTLGHDFGDRLLTDAAQRIRHGVRESDTVARLGGDEFVVIAPGIEQAATLGRLAQHLIDVLCAPFALEQHTAYISASIGIASYPADTDSSETLITHADQAMYAAKERGRNGYHFYSSELSARASERLTLESDLRQALANGELELYYQPKIRLTDGRLTGSEALLRWRHPQRGMVPPDLFIGIAEDAGLIGEIGLWVLETACRTARDWNDGSDARHKIAVNLSARQFQHGGNLYQSVCDTLAQTGCRPEWIELEITESLLLEDDDAVLNVLNDFRKLGITIAIDDFGTGYSALSYLSRFPVDTLKIDRSFIHNLTDDDYHAELVKAVISIARCLNQQVVAEGVETQEQAERLKSFGCQLVQGYHYGRPIPREQFESVFPLRYDACPVTLSA